MNLKTTKQIGITIPHDVLELADKVIKRKTGIMHSNTGKPMIKKVICFALASLLFALCFYAEAQQPKKIPRIGVLSPGSPGPSSLLDAFRQGLRELGYVEGQSIAVEYRFAEAKPEALPDLAGELVRLKVNVLLTINTAASQVAKNETKTIPIVFTYVADPGSVANLARPGGNVTGLTTIAAELSGKRLELIKALPGISRVAYLWNSANPTATRVFRETELASPRSASSFNR
jgi:putative ABC transport system substrate-binding protein